MKGQLVIPGRLQNSCIYVDKMSANVDSDHRLNDKRVKTGPSFNGFVFDVIHDTTFKFLITM